jgi:hypothetical protein
MSLQEAANFSIQVVPKFTYYTLDFQPYREIYIVAENLTRTSPRPKIEFWVIIVKKNIAIFINPVYI